MKTYSRFCYAALAVASIFGLGLLPAAAQSRNLYDWAWATRLGATTLPGAGSPAFPPSFDQPESLAADAAGNVLIAGLYDPDVVFDNPAVRYQVAAGALRNSYVAKYTPAGALAWSLDLTSNGQVYVRDVAVDASGNGYATGSYDGLLRINGTIVALANTPQSCFLTKVSPAGAPLWTVTIEPDVPSGGRFKMERLAVDGVGNCAVQGEFEGQVTLNGTTYAGASANTMHALVLRYTTQGVQTGAFAAYTAGSDQYRGFTGLALASTGEIYLGGYVSPGASLTFGPLPVLTGPTTANATGFVVKLSANNTASWLVSTTGPARQSTTTASGQSVEGIALGPQNRCYVVGALIGSTMALGAFPMSTGNPAAATGRDLFVARIAPDGTVESLAGGGGTSKILGLAIGPQGEATIGTEGGLDWGNVRLPGAAWPAATTAGLVQLDAAGVPQRGWQAGGRFFTAAVAVDGLNRPVLAGTYFEAGPFTFGTQRLATPYLWNTVIARTGATPLAARPAAPVAGLAVYPNPARDAVEVRPARPGAVRVQLLDALGRSVRAQALPAGQTRLDLAGVAPGAYVLRVEQGAARSYRTLVVAP